MSKFKLGGVPDHAYDLFDELHKRVNEENGEEWSKALDALLSVQNPKRAQKVLRRQKKGKRGRRMYHPDVYPIPYT